MPPPKTPSPRSRSAFAAAFLSLLFPGLGHAYAGAITRGLAFAAVPFLSLALLAGIVLRADRIELLGFVIQQQVLVAIFVLNAVALVYRLIAVVDAWQVARFLNAVDASGGGRLGRARLPLNPLSVAGLLAVVLVLAGGHLAVARYNVLALDLVGCVFSDSGDPACDAPEETPEPGESGAPTSGAPTGSPDAGASPTASIEEPSPIASGATGTAAPTLPPWDGKERLNVLLIGSDQRTGESSFNTDTLIVVSVDPASKQVAMFQVPRDMVDVPVPANARPVWGSVYRGKINGWFTNNRNRADLWPGGSANARGFNAVKAILGELYGLDIRYYVMVNFQGFRKVVDTLGGVQINVQIPVAESTYPLAPGVNGRIYIPAGPQHMTGSQALIYARSRHRAAAGDFDRGRRQQRVLISLREQMNASAIIANLPELVNALKTSVKTDVKTSDLAKLLALAESVDTRNIRSYVFAPSYYAIEYVTSPRGYIITPRVSRIRAAVKEAFSVDPAVIALRDRLAAEAAQVWVLNASGRTGLASTLADYLAYSGVEASAPNRRTATIAKTKVVVYNGGEGAIPDTIAYLEDVFDVTATMVTDPAVTADVIVSAGRDAPNLEIEPPG
jgi:LCP family protein required for cell wall assembly